MRKSTGPLNPALARVITSLGHTDTIVITDAGMPIPTTIERIDLALAPNVPTFMQTLRVVLDDLHIEGMTGATEMIEVSPDLHKELLALCAELNIELQLMPHNDLKVATNSAQAAVRSGDYTPFANVILHAGVPF